MPALRTYKNDGRNMPFSHPLGILIKSIKTGYTAVPLHYREELLTMGFDCCEQKMVERDRWSDEYMPALRMYQKVKGNLIVPHSFPKLGSLVTSIRSGNTSVPPQHEAELSEMVFFWCTNNLARHVTRMLGRPVALLETDAKAAQAVAQAAAEHARLLEMWKCLHGRAALERAGLFKVPFGTQSLGNCVERFAKDAAQAEK
jgi:hypothetical protein